MDLDGLEAQMGKLRTAIRQATAAGRHAEARALRARLREAERQWDTGVEQPSAQPALVPVREQVHRALTLLGAPTAAKMIVAVDESFFDGQMANTQLTSLRRDEEKSYRSAPGARPYYLCAALTSELLSPARGLLALSTWELPQRIIGPLSPRTDFLTSAIRLAEHLTRLETASPGAFRLLGRLAQNIPGGADGFGPGDPARVIAAAEAELAVHQERDQMDRREAAARAADRLGPVEQLFGSGVKAVRSA
ncbi:hypothetical protein [Herbidospora sp. RD11066]